MFLESSKRPAKNVTQESEIVMSCTDTFHDDGNEDQKLEYQGESQQGRGNRYEDISFRLIFS